MSIKSPKNWGLVKAPCTDDSNNMILKLLASKTYERTIFLLCLFVSCMTLLEYWMLEYILAQPWYAALAVVLVSAILLLVANKYVGGCWADVQNEMRMLSELHRQQNKLVNQKVMIIIRMIEELDSPVFLLNQHARLMYGNQKFSTWLGFHWTEKNGLTPEHFGFETEQDFWRLKSSSQNGNLRCRFSKMLS